MAFIETPTVTGSGVLIEGGYVITNAHVVWPFEEVRVVFPDGSEHLNVPLLNWDLLGDIAVLGPLETNIEPIPLIDGEDMVIGSDLFLIGYPGEAEQFPTPT
ncbi:MAG: trypsin-like peptidase domain-containing protein, partial [Chloroflexi bacterium]|nr:trypsin-like peptidase domain-containing protein [Chloroflexota bacterium]